MDLIITVKEIKGHCPTYKVGGYAVPYQPWVSPRVFCLAPRFTWGFVFFVLFTHPCGGGSYRYI